MKTTTMITMTAMMTTITTTIMTETNDNNNDGLIDYTSLIDNTFGNYNISTVLIKIRPMLT